jgi:hypothetical protein
VLTAFGPEPSRQLFLQLKPKENPNYPDGIEDNTHFSPGGAGVMAYVAVEAIKRARLDLAKYLQTEIKHSELSAPPVQLARRHDVTWVDIRPAPEATPR